MLTIDQVIQAVLDEDVDALDREFETNDSNQSNHQQDQQDNDRKQHEQ